jgi:hypothetical protein
VASPPTNELILGASEAASRLRCSEAAIADWVERGLLPTHPDPDGVRVLRYATISAVLVELHGDDGRERWTERDIEEALEILATPEPEDPGPPPLTWRGRIGAWISAFVQWPWP